MTNQPGFPVNPGAGLAAAAMGSDDAEDLGGKQTSTDQGVPVGAEDVRADEERASGDDDNADDAVEQSPDLLSADWPEERDDDGGIPVGAADAEEDRRRAWDEDDRSD